MREKREKWAGKKKKKREGKKRRGKEEKRKVKKKKTNRKWQSQDVAQAARFKKTERKDSGTFVLILFFF